MREFEKWRSTNEPKLNGRPREDAWRAALEWVLVECTLSAIGYKTIREELENDQS